MFVKVVLVNTSPFFCEKGLVSGLHRVVVQCGRTAPRLSCFQNCCHLEKQDGCHLEILFADCNLKMLLLIDLKLDKVEGQNPALF